MHMQSPIRRVLTEDWSAQSKSASAKSEGWSPKTKPSLRRVASEPGELGWKRSYGLVSIHTRPLLEHEVQPLRRVSTSLRLSLDEDCPAVAPSPPRRRLSLVIERRAAAVPSRTTITLELGFLLRLVVLCALVTSCSGLVVAMGAKPGSQAARASPPRYAAAPWPDLFARHAATFAPAAPFGAAFAPAELAPEVLDAAAASLRQMAPLRAQAGLVRLCLAAEHAMAEGDKERGIRSLSRRRVLAARFSEAVCALAFPVAFGAMRNWHEVRAPSASSELAEARRLIDGALGAYLPAGSYRVEGRVKSALSIFEKAVLRGKKVHDLVGLRVIVNADGEAERRAGGCSARCEEVAFRVGEVLLDGLPWQQSRPPKDYVSQPKSNGYQSLHLHLALPSGAPLEVQIRTQCMHETAEQGSASHGRYKAEALGAWLRGRGAV